MDNGVFSERITTLEHTVCKRINKIADDVKILENKQGKGDSKVFKKIMAKINERLESFTGKQISY